MKNIHFEIGFWHPFGDHAGETAAQILDRKQKEVRRNGWTLWSFAHRTKNTLELWFNEIKAVNPRDVIVFCSNGDGTKDPISEKKYCNYFIPVDEISQQHIPSTIEVPHPMGIKTRGSAFIVEDVIFPVDYKDRCLEWFYVGKKIWQDHRSSTFGEHLIRKGNGTRIGRFRAILVLKYPYLSEVGIR